jgi:hypothetical protein
VRNEILRLQVGQGRRYDPKLRRRILAWVGYAKHSGMSERECSKRLGVSQRRFEIWREHEDDEQPKQLVEIVTASAESAASATITFAIASPSGYRIDDQAVTLMRALA